MAAAGLRNTLVLPQWLADRPGLQYGFKLVASVAVLLDVMMEGTLQGVASAFPGYGTETALPLIGRNRGRIQGPAQPNTAFAGQLRSSNVDWSNAGGDMQLCRELQNFIPETPTVRVVNRAGRWVSLNPDGSFSFVTGTAPPGGAVTPFTYVSGASMNWDGNSNPGHSGNWSDIWIVVEGSSYPAETRTLSALNAAYGTFATWAATGWGVGQRVPRADVNAIRAIIKPWVSGNANVKCVVFAYSNNFNPNDGPTANGYCESWSFMVSGSVNTAQRPSADRYWQLSYSLPM